MSYYGDSYIRDEDPNIYVEPVRDAGDVNSVELSLAAPSRLPEKPVGEGTYEQDQFSASAGAGFTNMTQVLNYRLGLNVITGYMTGRPMA